jgi:tetratricopeptide (TPR) repeat protein
MQLEENNLERKRDPDEGRIELDRKLQMAQEKGQMGDFDGAAQSYQEAIAIIDAREAVRETDGEKTTAQRPTADKSTDGEKTTADKTTTDKSDVHPDLAHCLWQLANILFEQNQIEESIPLFKRLLAVQEEILPSRDARIITPLLRLAIALRKAGQVDESEETFARAMQLAREEEERKQKEGTSPQEEKQVSEVASTDDDQSAQGSDSPKENTNAAGETKKQPDDYSNMLKNLFSDAAQETAERAGYDSPLRLDFDLAQLEAIPTPDVLRNLYNQSPGAELTTTAARKSLLRPKDASVERQDEVPVKFEQSTKDFQTEAAPEGRTTAFLPLVFLALAVGACAFFVLRSLRVNDFGAGTNPPNSGSNEQTSNIGTPGGYSPTTSNGTLIYSALNNLRSIRLDKDGSATLIRNGLSYRGKYRSLNGGPSDFLAVVPGALLHSEIWLEKTTSGLKDIDGVPLYGADAPESLLLKEVTRFAQKCQEYHVGHASYPGTAEDYNREINVSYVNPFTKRGATPKYYFTYASSMATSAAKLEEKTATGGMWINETTLAPGEIHCCSLVSANPVGAGPVATNAFTPNLTDPSTTAGGADQNNPASQVTALNASDSAMPTKTPNLFIRACGADGQFLPGDKPGTIFYLRLEEGKSKTLDSLANQRQYPSAAGSSKIFIANDSSEVTMFTFLRAAIPAILIVFIGFFAVMQSGLTEKKDELSVQRRKLMKQLLIISAVAFSVWMFVSVYPG